MSKIFYAAILFAVVALCPSCKDDDKEQEKPTPPTPVEMAVSVVLDSVTECTANVTVDNKGGTRCALVWVEDGQTLPDDQAAFKTGVRISINKVVEHTVAPLKPETLYHIKAVVCDEEGKFVSKVIEVRTEKEKAEADVTVNAEFARARYFPEYNMAPPKFDLTLTTSSFSTNNPGVTGEGVVVSVSLFVPVEIAGNNKYIPDGTYISSDTKDAMTSHAASFQYAETDRHGQVISTLNGHRVWATSVKNDTNYKVFVRAFMEDGRVLYCNYEGPIDIISLEV